MNKAERLELILSVIDDKWKTYADIRNDINKTISIGGISNLLWSNIDALKDKIEWDEERFGERVWEIRTVFIKKNC